MARFITGTFIVGFLVGCLIAADWFVQMVYSALRAVGL